MKLTVDRCFEIELQQGCNGEPVLSVHYVGPWAGGDPVALTLTKQDIVALLDRNNRDEYTNRRDWRERRARGEPE
jgi:hypothetical protein